MPGLRNDTDAFVMTGVAAERVPKNVFGGSYDLNDVFNSITCFESNIVHEGYREGLKDGREETATRGFVIGFNTGSSVCLDLGYAISFCTVILQSSECSDRPCNNPYLRKSCEEVISKVKAYPTTNLENEDLVAKAEEIKIKLEKIKNILKMNSDQGENETVKQKFSF